MEPGVGNFHSNLNLQSSGMVLSTIDIGEILQVTDPVMMDIDLLQMDDFYTDPLQHVNPTSTMDCYWAPTPEADLDSHGSSPPPSLSPFQLSPASSVTSVIVPTVPNVITPPVVRSGRKRGAPAKTYQPGEERKAAKADMGREYREKKKLQKSELEKEVDELQMMVNFIRSLYLSLDELNEFSLINLQELIKEKGYVH